MKSSTVPSTLTKLLLNNCALCFKCLVHKSVCYFATFAICPHPSTTVHRNGKVISWFDPHESRKETCMLHACEVREPRCQTEATQPATLATNANELSFRFQTRCQTQFNNMWFVFCYVCMRRTIWQQHPWLYIKAKPLLDLGLAGFGSSSWSNASNWRYIPWRFLAGILACWSLLAPVPAVGAATTSVQAEGISTRYGTW